jgi:hypothetical protein
MPRDEDLQNLTMPRIGLVRLVAIDEEVEYSPKCLLLLADTSFSRDMSWLLVHALPSTLPTLPQQY